jgi:NitT/TauT family transport system ATP-binding protein
VVTAVDHVSFNVAQGEFVSVIGPSGCGKSTLFNIIGGLLDEYEGRVSVAGETVRGPHPSIGMIFQEESTFPWRTVLDNVAFPLEIAGMAKAERLERARHFVELVGLDGFERRYPSELSGGMRQRVGLARALSVDADVLLLDEPFSAVDEQNRRKFQEDLIRLRTNQNKTFIFVTHSIEEAVYISDRIVLLSPRPGRVSQIIEPEIDRSGDPERIHRDKHYLDTVEEIWQGLKQYVE